MSNLLLTMLQAMGAKNYRSFMDSTGPLKGLA
jgi:hypothetical protein